jgi:hypothetical protein
MTPTNSATAPARRPAVPTRTAAAQSPPAASASVKRHAFDHLEDEFRLNLSDIPKLRESMEVEGLKPTLLSRLFDLVSPLKA